MGKLDLLHVGQGDSAVSEKGDLATHLRWATPGHHGGWSIFQVRLEDPLKSMGHSLHRDRDTKRLSYFSLVSQPNTVHGQLKDVAFL